MRSRFVRALLIVAVWMTVFPSQAFAYLDPGTGSLIVQSVIAALAAAGFALRLYWNKVRGWFKWPRRRDPGE